MIQQVRYLTVALLFLASAGCQPQADLEETRALTRRWADELDSQTTESGVYIRHQGDQLPDADPWNNKLRVQYSQGGVNEIVKVTSAGPDGKFDTDDDIVEQRMTANLAGVGEGIKKNIGEVSENVASGAMKGTIQGVKEGIKENLPKFGQDKEVSDGDGEAVAGANVDQ